MKRNILNGFIFAALVCALVMAALVVISAAAPGKRGGL